MRTRTVIMLVTAIIMISGILLYIFVYKVDNDSAMHSVKQVSKHVMVPVGEEPAVLTITDKSKVKSEFLKSGETGDKVLIYQRSQRAIIYRPSTDKVVDIVAVSIGDASQEKPRAAWPTDIQ